VVIFSPYWVSYPDMTVLAGGKPVFVETKLERGFVPDPDDLARKLTDRTVAVVINSPCNPTGAVWPRDVLAGVAEVLAGHRAWIVTDDIYEHLLYTGEPFQNVLNVRPDLEDRTVVVNGLSKSFSMTGWRMGYAAGPKALVASMQKIQDQSTSNPTSFVQRGAIAALEGPLDFVEGMRRNFDERRRFVQTRLGEIPGVRCPEIRGAFYAFADFGPLCRKSFRGQPVGGSARLAEILLDEFRVAVVPGAPFGAEGFLRLSFATSMEQLSKGLDRVAACAAELS
jgi:aspartate aminotransferase